LARFIVFGSFVTDEPRPRDVDVFLLMDESFDLSLATGEASVLFYHPEANAHFGARVFWARRCGASAEEAAMIEL
jgi:hypothetical protein